MRGDEFAGVVAGRLVGGTVTDDGDRPHVHAASFAAGAQGIAVPALEPFRVEGRGVAPVGAPAHGLEGGRAVAAPDVGIDGEGDAALVPLLDLRAGAADAAVVAALPAPPVLGVRSEIAELVRRPEARLDPVAVAGLVVAGRLGRRLGGDVGSELRRPAAGHEHGPRIVVHREVLLAHRRRPAAVEHAATDRPAPFLLERRPLAGEAVRAGSRHRDRAAVDRHNGVQIVHQCGLDGQCARRGGEVAQADGEGGLLTRAVTDLVGFERIDRDVAEGGEGDGVHRGEEVLQPGDRRFALQLRLDIQLIEFVLGVRVAGHGHVGGRRDVLDLDADVGAAVGVEALALPGQADDGLAATAHDETAGNLLVDTGPFDQQDVERAAAVARAGDREDPVQRGGVDVVDDRQLQPQPGEVGAGRQGRGARFEGGAGQPRDVGGHATPGPRVRVFRDDRIPDPWPECHLDGRAGHRRDHQPGPCRQPPGPATPRQSFHG
ncbi:MAG: hypothetical protein BWZ02_03212 [Lentisphaerae bacterium ADurb.BinA184]|nr:MAG: hypothetical protein BWZ02_03212 [Lentisphaerae bacterium ADurb.BinA184]